MDNMTENSLVGWVTDKINLWRNHRDTNYLENWKQYERLWRGIWDANDRQRESERSRVITPALQQAIEGHTAEITEAVFGTGEYFFDIVDDMNDQQSQDVEYIKKYMHECFKRDKVNKAISDIILLGSLYGTGIGEIVVEDKKELAPATQPMPETNAVAIGVTESTKLTVGLRVVNPKNFLIDPTATTIEDAVGCAIEEYVSAHKIAKGMEDGVYSRKNVGLDNGEQDLEPTQESVDPTDDRVKLIRYYGLVPRNLLQGDEEVVNLFGEGEVQQQYDDMVEAIIVIANDSVLLKADESPYMMKDRPIIAYQDDSMPNRFWGRGVAEKGFNMQMALDAQMRAHLDSLALTTVPMMAMDATRMPRGFKFEVRPGSLWSVPPVDVPATSVPVASRATQPTVPVASGRRPYSCHTARVYGVSNHSAAHSSKPHARAKLSAPALMSMLCGARSIMRRASVMGWRTCRTPAVAPICSVAPSITIASISTTPSVVR